MGAPELKARRWQTFRRMVLSTYPPICHLCHQPINLELPGTHPQGPTVDHVQPRSRGGRTYDLKNCRPAHLACNSRKRDRTTPTPDRTQSRTW